MPTSAEREVPERYPRRRAWELVGQFFYRYARMEAALDLLVIKMMDVRPQAGELLIPPLDFSRKVTSAKAGIKLQTKGNDEAWKKSVENLFSLILKLNTKRIVLAHGAFEPDKNGGVCVRKVSRDNLMNTNEILNQNDFDDLFNKIDSARSHLLRLRDEMKPFVHSLDFSDYRNSMHIALLT